MSPSIQIVSLIAPIVLCLHDLHYKASDPLLERRPVKVRCPALDLDMSPPPVGLIEPVSQGRQFVVGESPLQNNQPLLHLSFLKNKDKHDRQFLKPHQIQPPEVTDCRLGRSRQRNSPQPLS